MSQDVVADCLNQVMNSIRSGKRETVVKRHSRFLLSILEVMKKFGYLDYSIEGKELFIKNKKINECKAIKPRYIVSKDSLERYVKRFLPSRDLGILIVSTNKGLVTHEEATEKNIGGFLVAYLF